jgi:hypothetical protein
VNRSGSPSRSDTKTSKPLLEARRTLRVGTGRSEPEEHKHRDRNRG